MANPNPNPNPTGPSTPQYENYPEGRKKGGIRSKMVKFPYWDLLTFAYKLCVKTLAIFDSYNFNYM